jgi:hypothetical protein
MALQSTVLIDIPDGLQSITYTLSGTQVDLISYSSNTITLSTISAFNLVKSDLLIYISSLTTFLNLLITNFPIIQNSRAISLPLSTFDISLISRGVEHIVYSQTSMNNSIYNINYVPSVHSAAFERRSQITITMQEFILACNLLTSYGNQISIN